MISESALISLPFSSVLNFLVGLSEIGRCLVVVQRLFFRFLSFFLIFGETQWLER